MVELAVVFKAQHGFNVIVEALLLSVAFPTKYSTRDHLIFFGFSRAYLLRLWFRRGCMVPCLGTGDSILLRDRFLTRTATEDESSS
jgi:hypothetical protein